jgi:predicted glycoside hydrolase/deacetylase ChbG (UPF0249 family)
MMKSNPVLKKLGYNDQDRLVIIHTDDIGMCQSSIAAFADLWEYGLISSGATMVPCSWFPQVGIYCREHPQADMGVHTTLTCEWTPYRWGPISTRDPASGLIDEEGYFPRTVQPVQNLASPEEVQIELDEQVKRALAAGIKITHVDTHMGTVAHPKFIPIYIQLGMQYQVPVMIPRMNEAGYQSLGMDAESAAFAVQLIQNLEEQGLPLVDHVVGLPLNQPEGRIEIAKAALNSVPVGITHFIIHPSKDSPELRAIAPDWQSRVADYQAFCSDELRNWVKGSGIQVIGYRALRELMRESQ